MDVDACASRNAQCWLERSDKFEGQLPGVAAFRTACRDSRLGTNVTASKLLYFIRVNKVVSTSAYVAAQRGQAEVQAMHSTQWGARRLAFETAISTVDTALYATLDLDGAPGDDTYGPFRLVAEPDAQHPDPVVLPHNSASGYAPNGVVDETTLCADAAAWNQRAEVAALRRGRQALTAKRQEWPQLLGAEDPPGPIECDLVEVVLRDGARPLSSVAKVRISAAHHDNLADKYAREIITTRPERDEDVVAFGKVTELVHAGRIDWEVIS